VKSLALVILLQVSLTAGEKDNYAQAWKATTQTGKPMVVLVGATWCPACVEMKEKVIPKLRQRGVLKRVSFAAVDFDRQRELGRELTGGGPIPQLLMYRKTNLGWRLRRLIGRQEVKTVETFITEGISLDRQTEKSQHRTPAQEASLSTTQRPGSPLN